MPLVLYRLSWLFFHWKSFTSNPVDQIIVHVFILAASSLFLPALFTIHAYNIQFQFIINQRCKIVPVYTESSIRLKLGITLPFLGKTSILDLFVCCLRVAFLTLVFGFSALPFAVSYEPIQWLLGSPTIISKLFACGIYFIYLIYAAVTVLSMLLIIIIIAEGILIYSSTIHFNKSLY